MIHPSAIIEAGAQLGANVSVGAFSIIGEHVEIGSLMKGGAEVREAMFVCEASGDAELASLARRLPGDQVRWFVIVIAWTMTLYFFIR